MLTWAKSKSVEHLLVITNIKQIHVPVLFKNSHSVTKFVRALMLGADWATYITLLWSYPPSHHKHTFTFYHFYLSLNTITFLIQISLIPEIILANL